MFLASLFYVQLLLIQLSAVRVFSNISWIHMLAVMRNKILARCCLSIEAASESLY